MTYKMFHTEIWDRVVAFLGGSAAILLTNAPHPFFDSSMFNDIYNSIGFILKAATGGVIAVLCKKLTEDIYSFYKKKYLQKKRKNGRKN